MLRRFVALVVLVGLVGGAWYIWSGRSAAGEAFATGTLQDATEKLGRVAPVLQDAKITASVKTAFTLNRTLEPYAIGVSTSGGVVTLSGQIARPDIRETALQIAAAVPDVQQVVDKLQVDAAVAGDPGDGRTVGEALDDRALEAKVQMAFSLNRNLQASKIDVRSFRRALTLTGEAGSSDQRALAVAIAQQTPNVLGVTDQIRVIGQSAPEAGALASAPAAAAGSEQATTPTGAVAPDAAAVKQAIAANPNLGSYGIEPSVRDGRLVLTGRVRTGAEKDLAGFLAREASSLPLDNALEVRP